MSEPILYIGRDRDEANVRLLQSALQSKGLEVLFASDAQEAANLIRTRLLHAVCVDGLCINEEANRMIAESLKNARPYAPVVLIQDCNAVQSSCLEEQADVVTDESAFLSSGDWIIEELRAAKFPVFTQWLEEWKQRSAALQAA